MISCKYNKNVNCVTDRLECERCEVENVYKQGRRDKYVEITSECILLTEEQMKQIKYDAIDEFVERITLPLTEEDIERIAKELKEQKNE